MGSFNIKCSASGSVIARNERCRVAVINQATSYAEATLSFDGCTYKRHGIRQYASKSSSMWEPKTAFMGAKYDDCGLVVLDSTPENQAILADLFNAMYRSAAVTEAGNQDNRGIAFDFQGEVAAKAPKLYAALSAQKHFFQSLAANELDMVEAMTLWDVVQHAIREGRVFYMGGGQVLRQLELAVVHETSFRRLVAMAEDIRDWDGKLIYARSEYFLRAFAELQSELMTIEDEGKRFFKKDNFRNRIHFGLGSELTRPIHWPFREIIENAVDLVLDQGQDVSAFLDRAKVVLDCLYAFKGLDMLNIQFCPITYTGQDETNFAGQQYAQFVAGAAKEISAARKRKNRM